MTAPSSLLDLDDAASVAAADSEGVMRSAALGGAQVRATAAAVAEGVLDRIRDMRPRSVVFVTGGGRAGRAVAVLTATVGSRIGIPILHLSAVPPWLGALDVVVVCGDDAGDPRLLDAADSATRRGAEVVMVAPDEGPLRAVGAGRAMALPPRVHVPDRHGFLRYLAAGLAVIATVESGRGAGLFPDLAELADELDAEALCDHPDNEVFHNPAKSLAVRMTACRVVLAGEGPATTALARHGAEILLRTAGVVAAAADLGEVLASRERLATGAEIFHDPDFDGPAPSAPARVFVLATAATRTLTAGRIGVLPDAEVVSISGERLEIEQLTVTAMRLEMAAAYLGLIGGG